VSINHPYLFGQRDSYRQKYTNQFYEDFAKEANRLYHDNLYSIANLVVWVNAALGADKPAADRVVEEVRAVVARCRSLSMLEKPGYGPRSKPKPKPKPKASKPKPKTKAPLDSPDEAPLQPQGVERVRLLASPVQVFDHGLSTDDMMDFVVQVIYCEADNIPTRHVLPLTRFRASVDDLLNSLN
jgi:hypothetical protein